MFKKVIITAFLFIGLLPLFSQQTNTMFFMDRIPQSNLYNPAYVTPADWHIGFPLSMIPNVGLSANSSLDINDFYQKEKDTITGFDGDLWVTPYHKNAGHFNSFLSSMPDINQFEVEFRMSPLNFGFKIKERNYVGFDWSINTYSLTTVPESIFEFPKKGNLGMKKADFSGLGEHTIAYQQFAVTYAREINEQLTIGASIKYLNGVGVASMQTKQLDLITAENVDMVTVKADIEAHTNMPLTVTYDEESEIDVVEQEDVDPNDWSDYFLFANNHGFAFDLGVLYKPKENILLHLAANDIGFINWAESPSSFTASNEYDYYGVYVDDFNDDIGGAFKAIGDSLLSGLEIKHDSSAFTTSIPMKLYLGAEYQFDEVVGIGLVGRTRQYKEHWNYSVTAALNLRIFRYGALAVSYSLKNNQLNSVGFGGTLRMGPLQWYLSVDNALGYFWYDDVRNASINIGSNFVFGRTPKYNYPKNLPFIDVY